MKSYSKGSIIVLLLIKVSVAPYGAAQEASYDSSNPACNTVYGELSSVVIFGAVSANYERMLLPGLSVRAGVGASFILLNSEANEGFLAMLLYHTMYNDDKFEAGIGLCRMLRPGLQQWFPAITCGYRYQPAAGGLFFRVGGSWSYMYGFPFQFSVGQTF